MSKKVAFVFNSRNNYHLFEQMFFRMSACDFTNTLIFNIDIDSTQEQKEYGRQLCKEYGIIDINMDNDCLKVSASRTMERVFDYIEENNLDIDWVAWWGHDDIIEDKDFIIKLENFIDRHKEINDRVGVIGFAIENHEHDGETVYGRAALIKEAVTKYKCSYRNLPESYLKSEYFIVEFVVTTAFFLNRKLYKKYVKPDYGFKIYIWVEDPTFQMLMNNVAAITIPSLKILDGSRLKPIFGVNRAYDSYLNNNNYYHLDNTMNHIDLWNKKWGFDIYREQSRKQIEENMNRFKDTLIEKIFNWSISDGPKTLKDI